MLKEDTQKLLNQSKRRNAESKKTNDSLILLASEKEWQKLRVDNINSTANCEKMLKAMLHNEAAHKNSGKKLVVSMGIYSDCKETQTRIFDKFVVESKYDPKKATRAYNRAYNKANTPATIARGSARSV